MPQNKSFKEEITGNSAHESPRINIHSFVIFNKSACIHCLIVKKTLFKHFLAYFTFHKKEMRLCHSHKRTNPEFKHAEIRFFWRSRAGPGYSLKRMPKKDDPLKKRNNRPVCLLSQVFERLIYLQIKSYMLYDIHQKKIYHEF